MQEYTAEIFIRRYLEDDSLSGLQKCKPFNVDADSLEGAIKSIQGKAAEKFPDSVPLIDRIFGPNHDLLYVTPWDELGPLPVSFMDA